jgi:hypothetical protein
MMATYEDYKILVLGLYYFLPKSRAYIGAYREGEKTMEMIHTQSDRSSQYGNNKTIQIDRVYSLKNLVVWCYNKNSSMEGGSYLSSDKSNYNIFLVAWHKA